MEGPDALRELCEILGELPSNATLAHVRIPPSDLGERDLDSDVGFNELGDLA